MNEPTTDVGLLLEADGHGFQSLYERYQDELYRFLVRLLGEHALAEDVLQNTFLRVYRSRERFDPERRFRPWLYTIARNAAANAMRAERKVKLAPEEAGAGAHQSDRLARELASKEDARDVSLALQEVSAEHRALLLQRHELGMKLDDLAASYDCTARTIRNRLHAAAAELAQCIVARRAQGGAA